MTSSLRHRFGTTSRNAQWSTGNGSPDAVCFSVDRAGVLVAGVGLYGGGGDYEFEMEFLDEVRLFINFHSSFRNCLNLLLIAFRRSLVSRSMTRHGAVVGTCCRCFMARSAQTTVSTKLLRSSSTNRSRSSRTCAMRSSCATERRAIHSQWRQRNEQGEVCGWHDLHLQWLCGQHQRHEPLSWSNTQDIILQVCLCKIFT